MDAEPIIASLCRKVLSNHGYSLEVAKDGLQARCLIDSIYYDAYIVDVRTPLLEGINLCEYVRQKYPDRVSRIGIISGDVLSQETIDFMHDCGMPYLCKPFACEELLNLVNEILVTRQTTLH